MIRIKQKYKPLPIGVDDFRKIIENDYFYVDKMLFVKELLDKKGDVNLFMRPRCFGKALSLSMLWYNFEKEYGKDEGGRDNTALFEGLNIMKAGEQYRKQMGQYPVTFYPEVCEAARFFDDICCFKRNGSL